MMPPTPDLMSDFSDTLTQSSFSGPDSPPRNDDGGNIFDVSKSYRIDRSTYTRGDFLDKANDVIAEETASQLNTPTRTPNSTRGRPTPTSGGASTTTSSNPSRSKSIKSPLRNAAELPVSPSTSSGSASSSCAACNGSLFSIRGGGKFVTVPGDSLESPSMTYHVQCFRCVVCDGVFSDAANGQAAFVKANGGALRASFEDYYSQDAQSKFSKNKFPPQLFDKYSCGEGHVTTNTQVKPNGATTTDCAFHIYHDFLPPNTRWHASCLVCGGKKETPKTFSIWSRKEEKPKNEPGCGKRLDSAAKIGAEGGVWCRECLLLIGVGGSPQASPTRAPLVPSLTGSSKVMPQTTGTTTLARQFTGLGGGGETGIMRQLTGGNGLTPTRSISPTKQIGGGSMRPRPKSVIGMRGSKSIDDGRGMFLVRQLTGAG
ncbi:hypothetical protein H0H81_003782 [Sphagnurus paluster]|uniref:LIM zinc-binding domain-containing protein n=1 Tax=Sphagnurus paluster TaxID=117069 RepID=A0A9P7GQ63_9AGAR|nr:hypothetical protein H0H81_003782 [Sphagnurus paluster]